MLVYALGTAQWIYKMQIKTAIWNGLDASHLPLVAVVKESPTAQWHAEASVQMGKKPVLQTCWLQVEQH